MTWQPHDPRSPPRVEEGDSGATDTVAKVAVFFACTLVVVIVLYAVNRDDQIAATTSAPAPATTTGQSQAPESKSEQKAESKGEQKAEPKSEPKSETKAEPKAK